MFSVRYLNRQLKRIVEDAAVVMPEGVSFFGTTYFIGNVNSRMDAAVNPPEFTYAPGAPLPAGCDPDLDAGLWTAPGSTTERGACFAANGANGQPSGSSGADGVPDGFPDVSHKYQAVEIELNKRFSHGWQLLANWRIAKVEGNFEGHFRNDNGQTDPAISSLFDFTEMSRRALGRHWADRTAGERDEFVRLFTDLMARSYIGKMDRYAGEAIAYHYGGGGGWGDPLDRDPERVCDDVLDEYVSLRSARVDYGVVLTGSLEACDLHVDAAATAALRVAMRTGR